MNSIMARSICCEIISFGMSWGFDCCYFDHMLSSISFTKPVSILYIHDSAANYRCSITIVLPLSQALNPWEGCGSVITKTHLLRGQSTWNFFLPTLPHDSILCVLKWSLSIWAFCPTNTLNQWRTGDLQPLELNYGHVYLSNNHVSFMSLCPTNSQIQWWGWYSTNRHMDSIGKDSQHDHRNFTMEKTSSTFHHMNSLTMRSVCCKVF